MLKLYENIRLYRKRAKMTQDELARLAGYTDRSSIAKIEKGLVDIAQSKIEQFASIFGVSAGALMGWDQAPAEELQGMGALAAEIIMDPDAMEMAREYMALSQEDRQAVRDFMALSGADRYAVRLVMASMAGKQKKTDAGASANEAQQLVDKAFEDM